jgi:hypothetical protein
MDGFNWLRFIFGCFFLVTAWQLVMPDVRQPWYAVRAAMYIVLATATQQLIEMEIA